MPWAILFSIGVLFSLSLSVLVEGRQAATAALRYVTAWESEIARSLLTDEQSDEARRILSQIVEFHPALGIRVGQESCDWPVSRSVSLYALPAAEITLCRNTGILIRQAAISPTFLGLLLVMLTLVSWGRRREDQAELRRLAAEARAESEAQLGRLARQVAHDIRGPVSALRALNTAGIVGEGAGLLAEVSERIEAIADDLLRRSKPAALEGQSIDEAIESLRGEFAARFPQHRIEYSLQAQIKIAFPKSTLQRILSNLVQNAAEASSAGTEIMIASREAESFVALTVADRGQGIPPEILERLGREEIRSAKPKGNGMALAEARNVLEKAGGALSIRSRPGVGTQVEMRLPV